MIGKFLHNHVADLSQILDLSFQHIFCSPNKFSGQFGHVHAHKSTYHARLCSCNDCACTIMLGAPLACVHAQIVMKFCLENR